MTLASTALWGIALFSVVGLIFGVALAATANKFHVPSDPLIDDVNSSLPAANCGACGFPGCSSYAEAVVTQPDVSPALCIPGGQECMDQLVTLTGKAATTILPVVAVLNCHGTFEFAKEEAEYLGLQTCEAASVVFGGAKSCKHGCLGLGDCERICPFDAIHVNAQGITETDFTKCTGCGKCVEICPKQVLQLLPRNHRVVMSCSTRERGAKVKNICSVGCISCKKCIKACPSEAVSWDGRIVVDHDKCIAYGPGCNEACVESCMTGIFHRRGQFAAKMKPTLVET